MFPQIVADIGGTNARFALVTGWKNDQPVIGEFGVLDGQQYPSLQDAIRAYVQQLDIPMPKVACIAIAGPVDDHETRMTNLDWAFKPAAVKTEFGFDKFAVINDFASLSIATSKLTSADLTFVRQGIADPQGNKAILGPGTGLGVAGLAYTDTGWCPIPSEGGHANIAPATELECEVVRAAIKLYGHVSAEVFISGPGLVNLYKALAVVKGKDSGNLSPKDISSRALDGSDALCRETLQLFCSFIGTFSGNLALTYGAKGGVYLAGGILPRFVEFIRASDFNLRFSDKGVMSHYVKDVPVNIISHEQPGLLGSAAWIAQQ